MECTAGISLRKLILLLSIVHMGHSIPAVVESAVGRREGEREGQGEGGTEGGGREGRKERGREGEVGSDGERLQQQYAPSLSSHHAL